MTGGILIGLASGDDETGLLAFSAGEKALIYGVGLGAVGTFGGAVAGASWSSERWERGATVFANGRVGVHVVPAGRRGAGLAVSVGF